MPGTFLPLVLPPDATFATIPCELIVDGQYIVESLVLIGAALAVGGTINSTG